MSPQLRLSVAHEAIAQATGYRDWHELTVSLIALETAQNEIISREMILRVILNLANRLEIVAGDVQFALTKARLFPSLMSLDTQLALRAEAFRQLNFGESRRGKPGSVVKLKLKGWKEEVGYLVKSEHVTQVLFESGPATYANSEVVTPRIPLPDFIPLRLWLPYGYWTLLDGSRIIYSRDYLPMWRITLTGVERLEPWFWIKDISNNFNFTDSMKTFTWHAQETRDTALAFLCEHRIFGLPRLVEVMPRLFGHDLGRLECIPPRLQLLREKWLANYELPSFAEDRDLKYG